MIGFGSSYFRVALNPVENGIKTSWFSSDLLSLKQVFKLLLFDCLLRNLLNSTFWFKSLLVLYHLLPLVFAGLYVANLTLRISFLCFNASYIGHS